MVRWNVMKIKKKKLVKVIEDKTSEDYLIENYEKKISDNLLLKMVFEKIEVYLKSAKKVSNGYLTLMEPIKDRGDEYGYVIDYLFPPDGQRINSGVVVAALSTDIGSGETLNDCYELRVDNDEGTQHWRKLMFVSKTRHYTSEKRFKLTDSYVLTYGLTKTREMLDFTPNGNEITSSLAKESKDLCDTFITENFSNQIENEWTK